MTTRTRKQGGGVDTIDWSVTYTGDGGPAFSGSLSRYPSSTTMVDEVIHNFKARSAAGEVFNNPMSRVTESHLGLAGMFSRNEVKYAASSDGKVIQTNYGANGTWYISHWRQFMESDLPTIDVSRVEQLAITKAYADRNSTDFSAFVAIGEAKSTVEWFISIFTRAIDFYRNWKKKLLKAENLLKHSKGKAAKTAYEDLENLRMEYRYAVRPLLADMEGVANALHGAKLSPRQTFRGFASDSVKKTIPLSGKCACPDGGVHHINIGGFTTYSIEVESRAGVLTEIDFSVFDNFSRKMGFTQSVAAAYDLLPLSFVLNWFINMGDFILAWQPNAGVKDLAAWVKTTTRISQTTSVHGSASYIRATPYGSAVQTSSLSGQSQEYLLERVERRPVSLASTAIRFDVNLDFFKILDLITISRNLART